MHSDPLEQQLSSWSATCQHPSQAIEAKFLHM
jgi:hypothetical protein